MNDLILVTGGCGFVGSNLVPKLIEQGNKVRVLDDLSKGRVEYLHGSDYELFEADIRDINACREAFKGVTKVVHLAAAGSVVESVQDPALNFNINVQGTFNMLSLAVEYGVSKFVFSSTGGALIGNAQPPVSEMSLPKPISPYGASKLCCEAYCHAFAKSYDLGVVCLRFANVYGINSVHKTGVVNKFTQSVMEQKSLTIFGDGSSTRDYIHVSDLCSGIVLALNESSLKNDVIHIATGIETSLKELAGMFLEIGGMGEGMIQYLDTRAGEVERNFALYDYANEILGYSPKVTLKQGMQETYEYLERAYKS